MSTVRWAGKGKRPFYGWIIVGVGFFTQFITGLANLGFASYLIPLGKEFGWTRTQLAGPRSISQAEGALLGPINGYLVDRFGPRVMSVIGTFIVGAGLILFGFIGSIWQYYAANLLIAVGTSFSALLTLSVAINNWFRRKRTLAMSFSLVGFYLAGFLAVPLVVYIQTQFGWRQAAIVSGIAVWILGIPTSLLLRTAPEPYGMLPDGDKPGVSVAEPISGVSRVKTVDSRDFTLRQTLRVRAFWLVCVGNGLAFLAGSAVMVHQFLHMEQGVGLTRGVAASAFAFMSASSIVGTLAGGVLGDRYPKHLLLAIGLAMSSAALVLFALSHSLAPVLVFSAVYGFSVGSRPAITRSLIGEYFGRKAYGKISGAQAALSTPLGVLGPVAAGLMADRYGNYVATLLIMAGVTGIGAVLFFVAKTPNVPKETTKGI